MRSVSDLPDNFQDVNLYLLETKTSLLSKLIEVRSTAVRERCNFLCIFAYISFIVDVKNNVILCWLSRNEFKILRDNQEKYVFRKKTFSFVSCIMRNLRIITIKIY